jgi:hypothetical protein
VRLLLNIKRNEGAKQNGMKTKISRLNIAFENLVETLFIEWQLRTGDIVPNGHELK